MRTENYWQNLIKPKYFGWLESVQSHTVQAQDFVNLFQFSRSFVHRSFCIPSSFFIFVRSFWLRERKMRMGRENQITDTKIHRPVTALVLWYILCVCVCGIESKIYLQMKPICWKHQTDNITFHERWLWKPMLNNTSHWVFVTPPTKCLCIPWANKKKKTHTTKRIRNETREYLQSMMCWQLPKRFK